MNKRSLTGFGCLGVGLGGLVLAVLVVGLMVRSTYNDMVAQQEGVNAAWSQVENV